MVPAYVAQPRSPQGVLDLVLRASAQWKLMRSLVPCVSLLLDDLLALERMVLEISSSCFILLLQSLAVCDVESRRWHLTRRIIFKAKLLKGLPNALRKG